MQVTQCSGVKALKKRLSGGEEKALRARKQPVGAGQGCRSRNQK